MVAPLPRLLCTATGRMRVRRGWFGRLVPQVEILMKHLSPWHPTAPGQRRPPDEIIGSWREWRDMTWDDALSQSTWTQEQGTTP
jgi:hypothetical protein